MNVASRGFVSIVGAGPGAPDLITARGLARIREADVLIYDRLIPVSLLAECPPDAERISGARPPGKKRMEQDQLEALMIEHARAGKRVVRLKGGDPCLFGRTGEDALALARAGIPFEIVPGVTSATAAPAAAGIPITHRELAGGVTILSARGDTPGDSSGGFTSRSTTRLVFMGLAVLADVVKELEASGTARETPVAMVGAGTTGRQRVVYGTLGDIAKRVESSAFETPAMLIVGDVAGLGPEIAAGMVTGGMPASTAGPLTGFRLVVLTRPLRGTYLAQALTLAGAECIPLAADDIDRSPARKASFQLAADLIIDEMIDGVVCERDDVAGAFREFLRERGLEGGVPMISTGDPEAAIREVAGASRAAPRAR